MSDFNDKYRALVAKREDEDLPMVIGIVPLTTWEVIDPEEWDEWKRETGRKFFSSGGSNEWTAYDYVEIEIDIPMETLLALYGDVTFPTSLRRVG